MKHATPQTAGPGRLADGLPLKGLQGTNPLGFLAALGTLDLVTNIHRFSDIKMSWARNGTGWHPLLHGSESDLASLSIQVAAHLHCPFQGDPRAETERQSVQKRFEEARSRLQTAEALLKESGLKGDARKTEEQRTLDPLRSTMRELRTSWLDALARSVPSLELSLGKHLNATHQEFRDLAERLVEQSDTAQRETVDLLSSFGSDACRNKSGEQIQPTPFCFTTGAGHQYFLDTVRQLTGKLDAAQFERALSEDSEPRDERLSMRWDPQDDRRYALMWSDPTDDVPRTNWALNLLGYRGLSLIPSVPTAKGLRTTGWSKGSEPTWTWPIWRGSASAPVVRSLLAHPTLASESPDINELAAMGIHSVFRAKRIRIGKYINFTAANCVASLRSPRD